MKKTYIVPQTGVYHVQTSHAILESSILTPTPGGGGEAGSRLFDDSELLQSDELDLLRELGMQ